MTERSAWTRLANESGVAELVLHDGTWSVNVKPTGADWRLAASGPLEVGSIFVEPEAERYRVAELEIDRTNRVATIYEEEVKLSVTQFDMLAVMARQPSRLWTHEELYERVWHTPLNGQRTRTIQSHASRVRVALREAGARTNFVVNVARQGYRLVTV